MANIHVQSPNIRYSERSIEADYEYDSVRCVQDSNGLKVSVLFERPRLLPAQILMICYPCSGLSNEIGHDIQD